MSFFSFARKIEANRIEVNKENRIEKQRKAFHLYGIESVGHTK